MKSRYVALVVAGILLLLVPPTVRAGSPLAEARLEIQGNALSLHANDVEQTVNVGEQARVRTCYGSSASGCGEIVAGDPRIAGLEVVGELRGPEMTEPIELRTVPGGVFLLPSFQREGDYYLENIRLIRGTQGQVVGACRPPMAVLHVRQILLASATVRALSLDELRARGIQLSRENYQAFNFAVGFAFEQGTVTIDLPVLFEGNGLVTPLAEPEIDLDELPESLAAIVERWQPPNIVPFAFTPDELPLLEEAQDVENQILQFPLYGAIVIPGTVSFLNQFFEARIIVANGAPEGQSAFLEDVTAAMRLPAGNVLRLATTDPPVAPGQQIPVLGANGSRTLYPQQRGSAVWTVEGLKTGTHALRVDISADLQRQGRPTLPLVGRAQAAIEVVDARFNLTFSHPDVVREGEAYSLFVTVTNVSRARQNQISVALEAKDITGAHKADSGDSFMRAIESLEPGDSETLEFALVSDTTGKCVATTFQSDSAGLEGTIRLRTGVGELGVPLSPATLAVPRFTDVLPAELVRPNVRLLGLAYSLATAPSGMTVAGLPALTTRSVERRAVDLAEAGRRIFLDSDADNNDGVLESLEILALDQLGNRHPVDSFDELRRRTAKGAEAAQALAALLRDEQADRGLSPIGLLDHLAETASYRGPFIAAVFVPAGTGPAPELEIRRNSAQRLLGISGEPGAVRTLPFGEIYGLHAVGLGDAVPLAIVGHVSAAEVFEVRIGNDSNQDGGGRLSVLVPHGNSGQFRRVDVLDIPVARGSELAVEIGASVDDPPEGFTLSWLRGGPPPGWAATVQVSPVRLPEFRLLGAAQDFLIPENYHGNGVAYLFNRPPNEELEGTPEVFRTTSTFDGSDVLNQSVHAVSTKIGEAAFIQHDETVVLVRYSGPMAPQLAGPNQPLVLHRHAIDPLSIGDRFGETLDPQIPDPRIETAPQHSGGLVKGRVVRGTGEGAAGATVQLLRVRNTNDWRAPTVTEIVETTETDGDGGFYFDFVEQPHWYSMVEDQFILRATVPASGNEPAQVEEVSSTIRQQNRVTYINIALLGRGTVTGHLLYDGGASVEQGTVSLVSTLFGEMSSVALKPDDEGAFAFSGVPVGPLTLTGRDDENNVVYATIGLEHAGESVDVPLIIQRSTQPARVGVVTGRVMRRGEPPAPDKPAPPDEPVPGADVAVYSAGKPIAQRKADGHGRFFFADVPAGQVSVQAADWRISRTPAFKDLLLQDGETAAVTLTLARAEPRTVIGTVKYYNPVTSSYDDVAGAAVFIAGPGVFTYTGANGSYRLEGVPVQGENESYIVTAIDYGRRLQGQTQVQVLASPDPEVLAGEIVLVEMRGGIDGVVLDPLGRPLAGAEVVGYPYFKKTTDGAGRFSVNNLPLGWRKLIAHVGDGLAAGRVGYLAEGDATIVYGGHRAFTTIQMRGSGFVRVHTATTSGGVQTPIYYKPTKYVAEAYEIRPSPQYLESQTSESGNWEREMPVGYFEIVAYNPFHGMKTITGTIDYPGQVKEYEIVFENAGTVTGTVLDVDGVTPAPGVEVTLETSTLLPQKHTADGLGRFTFNLVPPGNITVKAAGVVGGVQRVGAATGAITTGGQVLEVPVRMKAQGTVTGRVVERGSLTPVAGAQVYVNEGGYPNRRLPAAGTYLTADNEGRYRVEHVFAGPVTVVGRDPNQVTREGASYGTVTADWGVVPLDDIVLSTSVGTIEVTVRNSESGAIAPDAQVTLDNREVTVSDTDGRAFFNALPLGVHSVYAFHAQSGRGGRLWNLNLSTPGQHLAATVYLDQRGEVKGTLFDDPGLVIPVSGATVELTGSTSIGSLRALATTSGAAETPGTFSFGGIPEGSFDLEAAAPGSPRRAREHVTLSATAPLVDVNLVLERVGDVYVRLFESLSTGLREIVPDDGVFGVRIQQDAVDFSEIEPIASLPGFTVAFPGVMLERRATITAQEASGEQRHARLDLNTLEASAETGGLGSISNPYQLVLVPKGVVRVAVVKASLEPAGGATVTLNRASGGSFTSAANADGMATFVAVPAGNLYASASFAGGQGGTASGILRYDDEVVNLSITLASSVSATGVVYAPVPGDPWVADPSGLPAQAGAVVEITAANVVQTFVTGPDGRYRFEGLAIGACTVVARQPNGDGRASLSAGLLGPDGNVNSLAPLILDAAPPRLVSITPPAGAERVSRTATVELVFSEPLSPDVLPENGQGGGYFTLRSASGACPPGAWSAVIDGGTGRQIVRFEPSTPYENETVYGLTIHGGPSGVHDRVGRLLSEFGDLGFNFKTADKLGPEVVGTEPTLDLPVPVPGTVRFTFNEALDSSVVATIEWERAAIGANQWNALPANGYLEHDGYWLVVAPDVEGLDLANDTLRRRVRLSDLKDTLGNPGPDREFVFRLQDENGPAISRVPNPVNAPDGRLTAGTQYTLTPEIDPSSVDSIAETETLPAGDLDRVEYYLVDPAANSAAQPTFTSHSFPFSYAFVAAYVGDGVTERQLPVWVRAFDTSTNASNLVRVDLVVPPNVPPRIGSVDVAAISPVPGTFYAGSAMRGTVNGVNDDDGVQVTLSTELRQGGNATPLATPPAILLNRPAGGWPALTPPTFSFTLPLTVAPETNLHVSARVIDIHGANQTVSSPVFTVARDQILPRVEGLIAKLARDGSTPGRFTIGQDLYFELYALDAETAVRTVTLSFDAAGAQIFQTPPVAAKVAGHTSLYRTDIMTVPFGVFASETAIVVTATATDYGNNSQSTSRQVTLAPADGSTPPTAEWLSPWDGGYWPADYSFESGTPLLLRVVARDTDAEGAPGNLAGVELRGPVTTGPGQLTLSEVSVHLDRPANCTPQGPCSFEFVWSVPNDIPVDATIPFEARIYDTGNSVTVLPARLTARRARRVFRDAEVAVVANDPLLDPTGDPDGPVFLLDGSTLSVYPAASGERRLPSLFLYAGGPALDDASVLTVPEVTSYNAAQPYYPLELAIDDVLYVGGGCRIDVSGRGLLGNTAQDTVVLPGETPAEQLAGGSHGGQGWHGSPFGAGGWNQDDLSSPGSVYDSVRDPHLPGSGGARPPSSGAGGAGGGVVRLLAEEALVHLDGDIRADGRMANAGGGAGGAVLLRARRLEGRGLITADGSHAGTNCGGGGGGGRIALVYGERAPEVDLEEQVQTYGGTESSNPSYQSRRAGAGTIYLENVGATSGSGCADGCLIVANPGDYSAGITPLPSLGEATLAKVDVATRSVVLAASNVVGELIGDFIVLDDAGTRLGPFATLAQQRTTVGPDASPAVALTIDATNEQLLDLHDRAAGSPTITARGVTRYGSVEGRGKARIVVTDDIAIAPASDPGPPVNERSRVLLVQDARILFPGERPAVSITSEPPPGSEVRQGSVISLRWTVTDPIGVRKATTRWSLAEEPMALWFDDPSVAGNGAAPLRVEIGPAPPGVVSYQVEGTDIVGRSASETATWTVIPDQVPPTLEIRVSPERPNDTYTAGDRVWISAVANDDAAMSSTSLTIQGQTYSDRSFVSREWFAPQVPVTSSFEVSAAAVDHVGNRTMASRLLTVVPSINPDAPVVTFTCPADGDAVLAGVPIQIGIELEDHDTIRDYSAFVEGQDVVIAQPVGSSYATRSFTWTPDPGAAAGARFVVRVEASDYAGNVGFGEITLSIPGGTPLTGDQPLDASRDGSSLVLVSGRFTVTTPLHLESLVVMNGATVVGESGETLSITVDQKLLVSCGATVDVSGLGFGPGQAPAGVRPPTGSAGGSHGGPGDTYYYDSAARTGETYDSVYQPNLAGGGGAGGAGGGVLDIVAGECLLNGRLQADGVSATSGSGAAGAVLVRASRFGGVGTIRVQPGGYPSGGSGRVAIFAETVDGFNLPSQVCDWSSATAFVRTQVSIYGEVCAGGKAYFPSIGTGAVESVEPAVETPGAAWIVQRSADADFDLGVEGMWVRVNDRDHLVLRQDGHRRILLADAAGAVAAGDAYQGIYKFDAVTVASSAYPSIRDRLEVVGAVEVWDSLTLHEPLVAQNLTVHEYASISSAKGRPLRLEVANAVVFSEGSFVWSTGAGFAGGGAGHWSGHVPESVAPSQPDAGGSHGGQGSLGNQSGPAGESYDSVYEPELGGGGGTVHSDSTSAASRGGGAVDIRATSVVLQGRIWAQGENAAPIADRNEYSAGAGGTVVLHAARVSGSGLIDASGGRVTKSQPPEGSGGGGRVALHVASFDGFDPALQVKSRGGWRDHGPRAGAGTTFFTGPTSTLGHLLVDNGFPTYDTYPVAMTPLPSIGRGSLGSVAIDAADPTSVWIEPAPSDPGFDVGVTGMWVRVRGADYRVKEQASRRRILLDGAANAITVGDAYEGVYKFDSVTVKGRARVVIKDVLEAPTVTVENGSVLSPPNPGSPVVNAAKVSVSASALEFHVEGAPGAVSDSDGIASAYLLNPSRGFNRALTLNADGSFAGVAVPGSAGDVIQIRATDSHPLSETVTVALGTLPSNAGPPAIDLNRITFVAADCSVEVVGAAGSVTDANGPITVSAVVQRTGATFWGSVASDGSFRVAISRNRAGGDQVTLTAEDSHPQRLSIATAIGDLPVNRGPIVNQAHLTVVFETWEFEPAEIRPRLASDLLAGYVLHVAPGGVFDPDGNRVFIHVADQRSQSTWESSWSSCPGDEMRVELLGGDARPGDVLQVTFTDDDELNPMSVTVGVGPLPVDNLRPLVDLDQIRLLPLGFGFQVAGSAGALDDPDGPITIELTNARTGRTTNVAAKADGSFYSRLEGESGDAITMVARDSHTELPLATEPIELGQLPPAGVSVTEIALGGHVISRLRNDIAFLDDGTTAAWVGWDSIDTPLGGLGGAADRVMDDRTWQPLLTDGTDLVAFLCIDGGECPLQQPGRLPVIAEGSLVRGLSYAGHFFLASEGNVAAFNVVPPPLLDGTTGALTSEGATASIELPVAAGTHVLELLPAYPGEVAVLTDQPSAELLVIDVSSPAAPELTRTLDLDGDSPPRWGAWEQGELLVGRDDGSVEIWRWGDSEPALWTSWQPVGAAARGGVRLGSQLWVGLSDGRLQQVDLLDLSQPRLMDELALAGAVTALANDDGSLLVATQSSLFRVEAWEMPPEFSPAQVAWGHELGWSWVRTWADSARWGDTEGECDGSLCSIDTEVGTAPTLRYTDDRGIPSRDYRPTGWQPWGEWAATGDFEVFPDWYPIAPSSPAADRGTFGTVLNESTGWWESPWIATAIAGASSVDYAYYAGGTDWGAGPPRRQSLAATGPVAELVGFDSTLYVLDDGLGVWDLSDPANPVLASHITLFGADWVSAATLGEVDWSTEIVAAGGDPGRVVVIGADEAASPVIGPEIALPGLAGTIVDLARAPDGMLYVLADDVGVPRLFRFDISDPAAPSLQASTALAAGQRGVALDVGWEWEGQDLRRPTFVAVVREGWGVETYAAEDLAPIRAVGLPGNAKDIRFVPGEGASPSRLVVAAGFGHAFISVAGLPGEPTISEQQSYGAPVRFVQSSDALWSPWDGVVDAMTPRGFVLQPLPARTAGGGGNDN